MKEEQSSLKEFPEGEATIEEKSRNRLNETFHDFYSSHRNASILLKPAEEIERERPRLVDDLKPYRIHLGIEEKWNFGQFMNQSPYDDYFTDLQRLYRSDRPLRLQFSATRDANGRLQSEHCYLPGQTGMGKTNLCSLLNIGFLKRPNPACVMWVIQKATTADVDVPKMQEYFDSIGKSSVRVRVGEHCEEGQLPLSALSIDDIKKWFGMSRNDYLKFKGILYGYQRTGSDRSMNSALNEFTSEGSGRKYAEVYNGLLYGDTIALRKKDELKFKRNTTYFLDISHLVKNESRQVLDAVLNGWLNYFYHTITKKRKGAATKHLEKPDYYKKQWQGMLIFDEFYELYRNYKLAEVMKTVSKIGTQGRSDGTSLVIASQTVFGGYKEKVPLSQVTHIFQFKSSYTTDQQFVIKNMGWEKGQYESLVREVFTKVFPYSSKRDIHKGKIILFSKDTGQIRAAQLKLLE